MPDPAGDDTQSHSREHIGVVSLARNEGPAVCQSHALKRTPTGKDPSALEAGRKSETNWRSVSGSNGGLVLSLKCWTFLRLLPNAQHCAQHTALVHLTRKLSPTEFTW